MFRIRKGLLFDPTISFDYEYFFGKSKSDLEEDFIEEEYDRHMQSLATTRFDPDAYEEEWEELAYSEEELALRAKFAQFEQLEWEANCRCDDVKRAIKQERKELLENLWLPKLKTWLRFPRSSYCFSNNTPKRQNKPLRFYYYYDDLSLLLEPEKPWYWHRIKEITDLCNNPIEPFKL